MVKVQGKSWNEEDLRRREVEEEDGRREAARIPEALAAGRAERWEEGEGTGSMFEGGEVVVGTGTGSREGRRVVVDR